MKIEVKDLMLNYEVQGAGIPFICIHGWGVDHHILSEVLEPVFSGQELNCQRIYLDLPGMGDSESADWITGSDDMLDILKAFLDMVLPEQDFLIAGLSYGGYLVRGLLKDHRFKERILGGLFICPMMVAWKNTPEGMDKGFDVEHKVMIRDQALPDKLPDELRDEYDNVMVVQTKESLARFKKAVLPGLRKANQDFLNNSLSKAVDFSFALETPEFIFTRPVLFLLGRQDSFVGFEKQIGLMSNYTRSSFVLLDICGHNLPIEYPAIFRSVVEKWLRDAFCEKGERN